MLISAVHASQDGAEAVLLENGYALQLNRIPPSRILPQAYYDQALASIPEVYPESQILVARRLGSIGRGSAARYALIGYKKLKTQDRVTIGGIVTGANSAWSFETAVVDTHFNQTLLLVIETISELPLEN